MARSAHHSSTRLNSRAIHFNDMAPIGIRRSLVAFTLTAIAWLHCIVIFADASQFPWTHSEDTIHNGVGTPNTLMINSNKNSPRNLESAAYEAYFNNEILAWLDKKRTRMENSVFISYDPDGYAFQSTAYHYDDFIESLRSMSVTGVGGGDDQVYFYLGQTDDKGVVHGLVNIAAFLAHAMAVSIKYDVCDEFNMDATDFTEKYAVSNSCGQYGLSYQDEVCVGEEAFMTCEVDLDVSITAADSLIGKNAPPPLTCGPKESANDFTGHWDAELGVLRETFPYSNRKGVYHHQGCCWWGRGVLLTRGTCNFGKLNQFLGRQAAAQGWVNFFDVDLCIYPEVVCEGHDTRGLRWSVGYFEWLNRVETYQDSSAGVDYMKDLDTLIESGFVDINGFIDIVGMALPSGCVESNCFAEEERVRQERRDNFLNLVYNVLDLPYLFQSTPFPTPSPTSKPTQDSTTPPTVRQPGPPPPTKRPTPSPTKFPTAKPTKSPTGRPSNNPTEKPLTSPPTIIPTVDQTLPPQAMLMELCNGQSTGSIPINGCSEYVQCANGGLVGIQSCAAGLLFDSILGQCNWQAAVTCDAPTRRPTPEPTPQTPRPTRGIDLSPEVPQPPPISPSSNRPVPFPPSTQPPFTNQQPIVQPLNGDPSNIPVPFPTLTQPPFANQQPIGQPLNGDTDEQAEESYRPTFTAIPTFELSGLIDLPSGALLGARGNAVLFPFGILLMSAVGSFMFLS